MPKKPIVSQIIFSQGLPMQFSKDTGEPIEPLTDYQNSVLKKVGTTITAYLKEAEELLQGKYASIKDLAPVHLRERGNVLVGCCEEGVVIRYDPKSEEPKAFVGWIPGNFSAIIPMISQSVIYCHPTKDYISTIPTTGTEIHVGTRSRATGKAREFFTAKVGFDAVLEQPNQLPVPPNKPYCLLSVRSTLEFSLYGELIKDGENLGNGRQFMALTPLRLPVGWECIEVFPFFNIDYWLPKNAPLWAEKDILASVMMKQFRENKLQTLDPYASARKQLSKLLDDYKDLLDSEPEKEEILQSFLKENPVLLCPAYIKLWPKKFLGARCTDFVFRDAKGDYLLVELEKSTYRLFVKNGNTSSQLTHAQGQITDWKRYLEDNLSTVQRELGLEGISSNARSMIVIGRSQSLLGENKRKITTIENQNPTTKIMTYDDVLENARAVIENLLGPLWSNVIGNTEIYYLPKLI